MSAIVSKDIPSAKTTRKDRPDRNGTRSRIKIVAETLESYARRGVFRGFSQVLDAQKGKAFFKLLWHRDRVFEVVFDERKNTIRIPVTLLNVPEDSEMYEDLQRFIKARQALKLPDHRRIDKRKARIASTNQGGEVSLTLRIKDGHDEYGARKLIHLLHEIFLTFLPDEHYEYMIENFDLDPDHL
jgi:hypothetical protein